MIRGGSSVLSHARSLLLTLALISAAAITSRSFGWGAEGHAISAEVAAAHLSEEARAMIAELLPGEDLPSAAQWADEVRDDPEYEWTKPLHYINVPRSASAIDIDRDCATGLCVIGAIRTYSAKLHNRHLPRGERAEALRLLIHFIGDVHQPLHVSYRDDFGGNRIHVTFFEDTDTNLHRVWDTGLLRQRMAKDDMSTITAELLGRITPELVKAWQRERNPVQWADESLMITKRIYKELPAHGRLDQDYYDRNFNEAMNRLAMAGVRIAAALNEIAALPE